MNKNKVEFGTSNFHIGLYTVTASGVTLEKPMHVPGMRALSLEAEAEESKFHADDTIYFSDYNDNGLKGDLNMALFPDEFKIKFLNYAEMEDGGIGQVKGMPGKQVYFAFEGKGDNQKRRHIFFNASLGAIKREHKTIEDGKEVEEESIAITVVGDNASGLLKVSYSPEDTGYKTLFETPTIPKVKQQI
jgi:phi13 family phage major tail protein